jgi:hypothetical protein
MTPDFMLVAFAAAWGVGAIIVGAVNLFRARSMLKGLQRGPVSRWIYGAPLAVPLHRLAGLVFCMLGLIVLYFVMAKLAPQLLPPGSF